MTEVDRKSLQHSLRQTWMAALGVFTGAEGEVTRAANKLIESIGLPGRDAPKAVRELYDRVKRNSAAFEKRVDDGVKAAVAKVHKPLEQELASMRERAETLQKRIETLSKRKRKKR